MLATKYLKGAEGKKIPAAKIAKNWAIVFVALIASCAIAAIPLVAMLLANPACASDAHAGIRLLASPTASLIR